MEELLQLMKMWREGCLSDCEILHRLCLDLPASPITDMAIEVIGKMYQEEVAEWEEDARIADMIHSLEDNN